MIGTSWELLGVFGPMELGILSTVFLVVMVAGTSLLRDRKRPFRVPDSEVPDPIPSAAPQLP